MSDLQRDIDEIGRFVSQCGWQSEREAWQRIRARLTPDREDAAVTNLSLQSRIEFALRDAGFSNREAAELARRAAAVPDREAVAWRLFKAHTLCGETKGGRAAFEEHKPMWLRQADAAIDAMGETP